MGAQQALLVASQRSTEPNHHMHMTSRIFLIIGSTLILFCFQSQSACGQPSFEDPASLIDQMYDVLSGPPGDHDWELFQSLFHERAIMGAAATDEQGHPTYRSFTPAEYMERNDEFFSTRGFYVEEIHRITERFGDIIHLFSTYQFRLDAEGSAQPEGLAQRSGRGINSIQLIHDANRWWIISIQYTNERPDLPIPKPYGG